MAAHIVYSLISELHFVWYPRQNKVIININLYNETHTSLAM